MRRPPSIESVVQEQREVPSNSASREVENGHAFVQVGSTREENTNKTVAAACKEEPSVKCTEAIAADPIAVLSGKNADAAAPSTRSNGAHEESGAPSSTHQRQSSSEIVFSHVVRGGPDESNFASSDDLSAKIHDKYVDVD